MGTQPGAGLGGAEAPRAPEGRGGGEHRVERRRAPDQDRAPVIEEVGGRQGGGGGGCGQGGGVGGGGLPMGSTRVAVAGDQRETGPSRSEMAAPFGDGSGGTNQWIVSANSHFAALHRGFGNKSGSMLVCWGWAHVSSGFHGHETCYLGRLLSVQDPPGPLL